MIALIVVVFSAVVLAAQAIRWAARYLAVRVARRYIDPAAATRRQQPGMAWLVHKPHTQHARHAGRPTEAIAHCQWCRTEGPDTVSRQDCRCQTDCGEPWCSRKPRATQIPASDGPCGWCENAGAGWGCSCPAMCDSPFCMPGVAR